MGDKKISHVTVVIDDETIAKIKNKMIATALNELKPSVAEAIDDHRNQPPARASNQKPQ